MKPQKYFLQLLPKSVRRFFSNKYLLATAVFLLWFVACDQYSLFTQLRINKTINRLERDKAFYEQEIEQAWKEKQDLEQNTEKYSREKFYMSKENEEIFVFPKKEE